jgi:hypothetical protein
VTQETLFGPSLTCNRCGTPLRFTGPGSPNARIIRRSAVPDGYCASCAAANWLQHVEPVCHLIRDPEMLLHPGVQEQFGRILTAGHSDAELPEIDWRSVVDNWNLPFAEPWRRR